MKNFYSHVKSRAIPVAALCFLLIASILYQSGVFELPFISRSETDLSQDTQGGTKTPTKPVFSDGAVENPNAPPVSDSVIDSLNSSNNVSDVTGDTQAPDSSGESFGESGVYNSFLPVGEYSGYSVSYKDYSKKSVLAEITLSGGKLPSSIYGGSKIKVEFTSAVHTEDGIPRSTREFISDTAMAVELYMGYIIIDNGENLTLFSSKGNRLGKFDRNYFIPAYTRDSDSNPLFHLTSEGYYKYFRFDNATKSFVQAEYNDEFDNRGLYFDYTADWGQSDNGYNSYDAIVDCIVEMTPEEAYVYVGPITTAPESTTPEETTGDETTSEETTGEGTTAEETTAEETTAEETTGEETTAEETTGEQTTNENNLLARAPRTEILPGYDSATEFLESEEEETTAPEFSYTLSEDGKTVYVKLKERRWAFGKESYLESDEYKNNPDPEKLSEHFKYYRLYGFGGGLCATVSRKGVLSFVNASGECVIERECEYYGQNDRKLLSSYREPLLLGIDSLGSLYFDCGYVLIRQVDIDSEFTDKLSGDYIYLVDKKGERFNVPAGYDIISYSDGVLLLEKDGYFGYYSVSGKWIAQPIFTYARPFAEGLGVIGFSGSVKGVVDTEGNIIVPFKYDYISQVSSGVMALHADDGWHIIAKLEK